MKRVTRTLTCDKLVWDTAKRLGFNISRACEDSLKMKISPEWISVSNCYLCKEAKEPSRLLKFSYPVFLDINLPGFDGKERTYYIFVCSDCFNKVKEHKAQGDKDIIELVERYIAEENKILANDKGGETHEFEGVQYKTRAAAPFENHIGLFEGDESIGDQVFNSTTELLKEIKSNPSWSWKFEPGLISVPNKQIWPDWED